ncbi:kinase-like domain-containing protein [Aspergillus oleicola]
MDGDPLLIQPEGAIGFIALGSAGAIFQDSKGQVIKTTLKHDVKGCSRQVIEHVRHIESISEICIDREKTIYKALPKHPRILDCLETKEKSLYFPFCRLGNLRDYLQHNEIDNNIRDRWVRNAIDSIAVIHAYGVIHADISPRNFLVADDLSIKLCDFAGSAIGDLPPLVEEEDRYRISPLSPRNFKTDLFALGCLVYEISTGIRP